MLLKIVVDDLSSPEIIRFLQAHVSQMLRESPPGTSYALDLEALRRPEVTLWSVAEAGTVLGCAAIKRLDAGHAELKSMRTEPTRSRTGIASRLLTHILLESKRMGFVQLSLETGTAEFFRPARRLYEKFGFEHCGPFADYRPGPDNTFLTRML